MCRIPPAKTMAAFAAETHINCDRNTLISTGEGGEEESHNKSCSDFLTNWTHIAREVDSVLTSSMLGA